MVPSDFCRGGLLATWSVIAICLHNTGNIILCCMESLAVWAVGYFGSWGFFQVWASAWSSMLRQLKAATGHWPDVSLHLSLVQCRWEIKSFQNPATYQYWRLVASFPQQNPFPALRVLSGFQPSGCGSLHWQMASRRRTTKKSKCTDACNRRLKL